jgi:D-alanine transaminase
MTESIWINGEIMPLADARISVEDRGFQFADGVYEVIRLYNGQPFALDAHLQRLQRSAAGIQLGLPVAEFHKLKDEIAKFLARFPLRDGMIYLQLTRGTAPRNHAFPESKPTLLFYTRELPPLPDPAAADGVKLLSVADERWKRCWIKSIALLPNVLAKNQAIAAGADEAVFINNGVVTECAASNIFAVIGGRVVTHPVGAKVLPGITRDILLEIAPKIGIAVEERAFSEEKATEADEVFITSTTREISWVKLWNERTIGKGRVGPITLKLHEALREIVLRETA